MSGAELRTFIDLLLGKQGALAGALPTAGWEHSETIVIALEANNHVPNGVQYTCSASKALPIRKSEIMLVLSGTRETKRLSGTHELRLECHTGISPCVKGVKIVRAPLGGIDHDFHMIFVTLLSCTLYRNMYSIRESTKKTP